MTHDKKNGRHGPAGGFVEKRKEKRYRVPSVYRQHVQLRVRKDDACVHAEIDNFSRSGILFISPEPFDVESYAECVISMSKWLAKDVSFGTRIKSCVEKEGSFLIGASIESVADAVWFEVFVEIHDFVVRRQGAVY